MTDPDELAQAAAAAAVTLYQALSQHGEADAALVRLEVVDGLGERATQLGWTVANTFYAATVRARFRAGCRRLAR